MDDLVHIFSNKTLKSCLFQNTYTDLSNDNDDDGEELLEGQEEEEETPEQEDRCKTDAYIDSTCAKPSASTDKSPKAKVMSLS